jgi:capsular exopolysaccharide synthesis family protein
MARPTAGDAPAALPPSPFQAPPPAGLAQPVAGSPFNYTNQPSMPAAAVPSAPTPAGLWNAFRRRWVLGTFLGALVAAAVAIGVWSVLPGGKHEVHAFIKLKPRNNLIGGPTENFGDYRERQRFIIKSRTMITQTLAEPAVASLDSVRGAENPVQAIEGTLKVNVVTDDILQVMMTGNNIDDMKVLVEHLVKRYVDDATGFDQRERAEQRKKIEQLSESTRAEIEALEKNIELLVRANGTSGGQDSDVKGALLHQKLAGIEGDITALDKAIASLKAEITVLKKDLENKDKAPVDQTILNQLVEGDPKVGAALAAVELARANYNKTLEVAEGNKEADLVKKDAAELERAEKELGEVRNLAAATHTVRARSLVNARRQEAFNDLTHKLEVKQAERESAATTRDALTKAIGVGAGVNWDILRMRDALKPQRESLEKINATLAQFKIAERTAGRVEMHGEVEKVAFSNQNRKLAMSGFGGLVSFLGVVLLVAFLEWRTRRIDGVDQVVTELGLRVIGTVPAFPNRANLKAAVEAGGANWRFVLNESINSARTMLLHTARTQSMQVVMVTSATQGEGKTSLASQLATSMATAGMRTLIVDCDLRNPSVQKLFELPLGPGVSEVLRQEVDVADAVQATAVPNLWVIPAGHCSNATIAALAQGHPMETLFNRLRGQFDFIIVDSCPVLPVADALLIGQHVDGVVFSIMQDISQLPKVLTATEKMNQLNIPLVGAVVNGIKQDVYSYGYNYVKQLPA